MLLPAAGPLRACREGILALSLRVADFPSVPGHRLSLSRASSFIGNSIRMSSDLRADHDSTGAAGGGGTGSGDQNREGLRERKKAMRKRIKSELKAISEEAAGAASAAVAERLLAFPQLEKKSSGGGGASVYLSMPGELGTAAVVSGLFKQGWKVYIPKVMGKGSADMRMFPLLSEEEVAAFPLTKWKIPEPSEELVLSREDGVVAGDIDVVVVPGVAFDSSCNRLGHGRGHYDCFFERVNEANKDKGRPPPVTMGVCFDEQVVGGVPTEPHDSPLDFVLTPTRTFRRGEEASGT